ncbi:hypothetical protein BJF92_11030 [Rhizobium rhizosphaerae]|uniref:Uncharacterized protein n=1 Tax=Xaviernesmea rhizosphaerae TaxID=1672749 RepID=A0A1Q9AMQ4_9HYPH|nr:hypothetical protein [Xaviernesmea rhizosphaerae]OLP56619.1 hypothetical protein BJF92_11030 [Xaviernesmea rhizosphaerae]OQP88376.1 hypothetical protein BTR14_02800 [Xaviernesmea rhizosphaerae]
MVASLIKSFWRNQAELSQAILSQDEAEVARLDAGARVLLRSIVDATRLDPIEGRLQIVFLLDFIRFHADDPHVVVECTGHLERLLLRRDAPCEAGLLPAHNPVPRKHRSVPDGAFLQS